MAVVIIVLAESMVMAAWAVETVVVADAVACFPSSQFRHSFAPNVSGSAWLGELSVENFCHTTSKRTVSRL